MSEGERLLHEQENAQRYINKGHEYTEIFHGL